MDPTFALDAKEQVRQAVDIVDLISSYNLSLRRQGRNFVALCPWHDDTRPSLQVNPERQSFKCWVCDIGGDVFSFVMRMEGVEFREALEMLAERAGVTLRQSTADKPQPGGAGDKRTLLKAVAWAEAEFHRCLLESPAAQPARDYLAERKISDETIRQFHLGFAPDSWDWLLNRASSTQWTHEVLERVGLIIRRDTGDGYYDRFRGRVMFSIRDFSGRPIAFGGRVLPQLADERSGGKYINSPESPLFAKSREFYGLDQARDAIGHHGQAIVVEGYTDCLMAHQNGLPNVIAVLGTALGDGHLLVLRRYTDSIVLVLDGDEAGRRRTNEILELFVGQPIDLRILTLPEGVDPCDFIASHGSDEFQRLVTGAPDALEHKLAIESKGLDVNDTHRMTQAAERVLTTLAHARPGAGVASSSMLLREQQMLTRTARHFRLPAQYLDERLKTLRRNTSRKPLAAPVATGDSTWQAATTSPAQTAAPKYSLSDWSPWERELLELVLLDANHLSTIAQQIDSVDIATPLARRLYEVCIQLWRDGYQQLFDPLMLRIDDPSVKNLLVSLEHQSQAKSASDVTMRLEQLMESHRKRSNLKPHFDTNQSAESSSPDDDEALAQFLRQSRPVHLTEYQRRNA